MLSSSGRSGRWVRWVRWVSLVVSLASGQGQSRGWLSSGDDDVINRSGSGGSGGSFWGRSGPGFR